MAAPNLSQKQLNFARFSVVCVDIIKLPLKDILNIYIKPTDLEKNIKACPSLRMKECKLNPDQQRKCFNSSNIPDYSKFDVALLYKLIRNLCPSLEPTNKWGQKPTVNDVCIGDDIERIRVLRNEYFAHTESAEISDDDFKKLWHDAKCVINRCQSFTTSKGCKTDYNQMLKDLERQTLTFDEYISCRKRSEAIYIFGHTSVLCGETACFEAEITLEQDVDLPVSWHRVDRRLVRKQIDIEDDKYKGSDGRQLFIHNVGKDDEAGYQAVISRKQDVKILSNEVYMRPLGELPCLEDLIVTSKNEEIYIHYVYKLLDNSPNVKEIRWTHNSQMLDFSNNKYRGGKIADTCNWITILSPGEEDKGDYICTISNAVGSVSKEVKLDIPSAQILSAKDVIFGSDTRFDCFVTGYPPPDKVEWQSSLDGTTFHPIDIYKEKYFGSSTDPRSPFLLVRKANLNDQQYYQFAVWNLIGKCTSNNMFLQVTGDRPNMSEGTCTLQGHSVKLRCDIFLYDDSPALTDVYWTKDDIKLITATSVGKYVGVNITDPSLTINNVNHNDAGDYQLIALNAVGETRSKVIVLGVPEVLLEKYNKKEDGSLWFTMKIKSVPAPHAVKWSIKENGSDNFQPINVNAVEYKGTTTTFPHPVLVIKYLEKLKNSIFTIEVKNRIGEVNRKIPGNISQDILKRNQKTIGKFHTDGGSRVPFSKLLNGIAKGFPKKKINQLKNLIQLSCDIKDVTELYKANTAADCFMILWKEDIITISDVVAMQFLLNETECEELERKCVQYAKKQNALYFYEKPPENGFKNVRFHIDANLRNFTAEDETKIRETVANIVDCSIEDVQVNGYLHSTSFFLVLSIREIYISKLLSIKQHDKDILSKLNIDYFKDDIRTITLKRTTDVKDEHKAMFFPQKGSVEQTVRLTSSTKLKENQNKQMAFSEPQISDTAQEYLVCGIENCARICQFYCNPCHITMCEQCSDDHQKSLKTKNHEVVPYRNIRQLPVVRCSDHPNKNIDILCDECNMPVCSKCITMSVHKGHSFTDLETIYPEKYEANREKIQKIQGYLMPTAQILQKQRQIDATSVKTVVDGIRSSMRGEAISLKLLVDELTSDNIEQVNKMEKSLIEMLQTQDKTYKDYISYLMDHVKKLDGYLSSTQIQLKHTLFALSEHLKTRPIPGTTKPVPPILTPGRFSREDVAKLLGRITVFDTIK